MGLVQLSGPNFPTESFIAPIADLSALGDDVHIKKLKCIIKGVDLNGDAVISVACSPIHRDSLPGFSAVHAPTQGSNPGLTSGRPDHGRHKRARRPHRLLRFLVALYRKRAGLTVTLTSLYYTSFNLRRACLPVDLAFL